MGEVQHRIELGTDKQSVWEFIVEPENFPKYVAGYENGQVKTRNETGMGSSFEWHGKLGPLQLKSTETVVEWEEGRRVGYAGGMAGVSFRSSMTVEASREKGCLMDISIRYNVPLWMGGHLMDRIVVNPLVKRYVVMSAGKLKDRFGSV